MTKRRNRRRQKLATKVARGKDPDVKGRIRRRKRERKRFRRSLGIPFGASEGSVFPTRNLFISLYGN